MGGWPTALYVYPTLDLTLWDLALGLDWNLEPRLAKGVSVAVPCEDLPRLYQSQACDCQEGIEERRGIRED